MADHHFITQVQYEEAEKSPVPSNRHFRKYEAPYFVEALRQQLEAKYGHELYTSGYRIYSTLDFRMQQIAEEAVKHRTIFTGEEGEAGCRGRADSDGAENRTYKSNDRRFKFLEEPVQQSNTSIKAAGVCL